MFERLFGGEKMKVVKGYQKFILATKKEIGWKPEPMRVKDATRV